MVFVPGLRGIDSREDYLFVDFITSSLCHKRFRLRIHFPAPKKQRETLLVGG